MAFWTKVDALLLLFTYAVPVILGLAFIDCIALMFLGEMAIFSGWWVLLFIGAYNSWGNFSPFYQIAAGALLDGMTKQLLSLPLLSFSFYFYLLYISIGFVESIGDTITSRQVVWDKTDRTGTRSGATNA